MQYCFDPAESELTKVNVAGFIFPVHISFLESKLKWIEANCWICRNKTTQVARFLLKLGRHSGSVSFILAFRATWKALRHCIIHKVISSHPFEGRLSRCCVAASEKRLGGSRGSLSCVTRRLVLGG